MGMSSIRANEVSLEKCKMKKSCRGSVLFKATYYFYLCRFRESLRYCLHTFNYMESDSHEAN